MLYFSSSIIIISSILITALLLYISYKLFFKSNLKNYILIKDYETFSKFVPSLKKSRQIAIDTEYYHENTYKGILCLIQLHISRYKFSIIVDLIELKDKSKEEDRNKIYAELKNIFENKKIEKIFHSCHNDIKWIYDAINSEVINIFDTQLMDNYIENRLYKHNKQNKNLNNLLSKYLNINFSDELKKKFQRSNWFKRPLSSDQLTYAANDALYLIELRKKMFQHVNNEKEFASAKKEINLQIKEKIEEKKDEMFKNMAKKYISENMTIISENEYLDLAKELFIDLMKKVDEFASENNVNTEKLFSINCIYHICNKLPKTKEKIISIIEHYQNVKISDDKLEILGNKENNNIELNNKINKFYNDIIEFTINRTKEIEKYLSEKNPELGDIKNVIDGRKANILKSLKKEASKKNTMGTFICKHPIYESCKMLAPDGQQLCYCDNKKMTWYVSRNLAEIISEDPPVFRLFFEPNARGCKDENDKSSNFYITSRTNCCVICGQEKDYLRFHIIPLIYRSCFPENLKSHKSHDVVLLCLSCHERARLVYEKKKKEISNKYNVPLNVLSDGKVNYLKLQQFQKKCKVLLRVKNPLPEEAKNKIKKNLINSFTELMSSFDSFKEFVEENEIKCEKEEDINDKFCELFSEKFEIGENMGNKKNMHGQLVLEKVKDLKEFIREWRKFFVDSFNPQFLPSEWSIDHEIVRTFGEHSNFKNKKIFMDNKSIQTNK